MSALVPEPVPARDWRDVLLRLPSRRPQKGRQAVRDISGEDVWAGNDADFGRAVAFTPAAFLWNRAKTHLVELPALWARIPLAGRDAGDVAAAAAAALAVGYCPLPHLVVEGAGHVVVVWAIKPLRRPAKEKPEPQHFAFRRCLEDWRRAAIKLSFALEPLGCRPLAVATADELLCDFIPLPFVDGSSLGDALGLQDDPPRLVHAADEITPIVIADVSRPLHRFDARMFATLGVGRPTAKKQWLRSATSLAALEPKGPGERHPAAVQIACAAVWDGEGHDEVVGRLRAWAATCAQDGTFPFRRGQGDELELIAAWAVSKLKPGGPDRVRATPAQDAKRTTVDAVVFAIGSFLASAGGSWAGSKVELAQQVALWCVEHASAGLCPLTTLKRALTVLKGAGDLVHEVVHDGRTWRSTWRMASSTALSPTADLAIDLPISDPRGQKGESTWAPGLSSAALPVSEGAAGERLLPAGGVQGGPESISAPNLVPSDPTTSDEVATTDEADDRPPLPATPENRSPRQRRLRLPRDREDGGPRRRKRGTEGQGLPPLTDELIDQLADVAPSLSREKRAELLTEARSRLRPREKVLADFAAALRRRALRIHRKRVHAAQAPSSVHEEAEFHRRAEEELSTQHPPLEEGFDIKAMFAAAQLPFDERRVVDRAQRLHAEGLHLVPLEPRSKEPATRWSEWQQRQMPMSLLRRQLAELGEEAGLAIICGSGSGVVVADLDDEGAVAWAEANLPPTPWRTKTSRGEHWFYRCPKEPLPSTPPPWTGQLQGDGRYVVAPGSLHPDGHRYRGVGDWTQSKEALPIFDARWLVDVAALRAARLAVLKRR